jgi:hypothetical protein
MYFSVHGRRNRCNFADFLLFLHVNGKNSFHLALNQRHPLVCGTVQVVQVCNTKEQKLGYPGDRCAAMFITNMDTAEAIFTNSSRTKFVNWARILKHFEMTVELKVWLQGFHGSLQIFSIENVNVELLNIILCIYKLFTQNGLSNQHEKNYNHCEPCCTLWPLKRQLSLKSRLFSLLWGDIHQQFANKVRELYRCTVKCTAG